MTGSSPLYPRRPVPALEVPLVGGGTWRLAEQSPRHFTMIVFYRGLHCPICAGYLADLEGRIDDFAERGVSVVAISADEEDRARKAKDAWKLDKLPLGYGLSLAKGREWGLYVSSARSDKEPALFTEPGLFMVRPDGTLYLGSAQTMPFARPPFTDVLKALDFVVENDYPARGEVADEGEPAAAAPAAAQI